MKQNKKWPIRVMSLALAAVCLCGGVALAAGDKTDPLITLSYLEETFMPDLLKDITAQTENAKEELEDQFSDDLDSYESNMNQLVAGAQAGDSGETSAYAVVSMTSGQKMALGVGCEVMLRVGSATVTAATSPALIDTTTGDTLTNGGSLVQNHLYMATISDRTLNATASTVMLLVRGSYTVY